MAVGSAQNLSGARGKNGPRPLALRTSATAGRCPDSDPAAYSTQTSSTRSTAERGAMVPAS
jgi:hypothetical protein